MNSRSQGRGRRQHGPGIREQGQSGQARPHSSQGKDRQHRHSEAGQAMGRAQGQEDSMETQQDRHTHHAQQTEPHGTQGKRGSRGTRQARGQAAGNTGTEGTILNMRHTETSNCAIVVAWQESERGRARQGQHPDQPARRERQSRGCLFCFAFRHLWKKATRPARQGLGTTQAPYGPRGEEGPMLSRI